MAWKAPDDEYERIWAFDKGTMYTSSVWSYSDLQCLEAGTDWTSDSLDPQMWDRDALIYPALFKMGIFIKYFIYQIAVWVYLYKAASENSRALIGWGYY